LVSWSKKNYDHLSREVASVIFYKEKFSMLLSEQHQMIRDALRDFSQQQLAPNAARWDKEREFPKDALKQLAALGAFGVAVPQEDGGAGLDYLSLALVIEEIAAGDGGVSTIISVNNCPVCSIAMSYANEAQKRDWLLPLAKGDMLGAFCLTEPHAGSDASALRTTARRDGRYQCFLGTHDDTGIYRSKSRRKTRSAFIRYCADSFRGMPHTRSKPDSRRRHGL